MIVDLLHADWVCFFSFLIQLTNFVNVLLFIQGVLDKYNETLRELKKEIHLNEICLDTISNLASTFAITISHVSMNVF